MNHDDYREVDFNKYCKTCKHEEVKEVEDPCNECLDEPYEGSLLQIENTMPFNKRKEK